MKNSIKIVTFCLVFLLSANLILAQKVKPTRKTKQVSTKPTPKTTTPQVSTENQSQVEEYFKQGKAFWKEFEIQKAIDSYNKALEINPNYVDALSERGIVHFMINQAKKPYPILIKFSTLSRTMSKFCIIGD